jgi:hypothetical protein
MRCNERGILFHADMAGAMVLLCAVRDFKPAVTEVAWLLEPSGDRRASSCAALDQVEHAAFVPPRLKPSGKLWQNKP